MLHGSEIWHLVESSSSLGRTVQWLALNLSVGLIHWNYIWMFCLRGQNDLMPKISL